MIRHLENNESFASAQKCLSHPRGDHNPRTLRPTNRNSSKSSRQPSNLLQPLMHTVSPAVMEQLAGNVICRELYFTEIGCSTGADHHHIESEAGSERHLLLFCASGAGWVEVNGGRRELKTGQAALIPAGTTFSCGTATRKPWAVSWVRFTGDDSDYYIRTLAEGDPIIALEKKPQTEVSELIRQMFQTVNQDPNEPRLIHGSHLLRLLLSHLLCGDATGRRSNAQPHHPGVNSAIVFMQANVGSPAALSDIARHAGLSVSHFCSLFRDQVGVTPMDYFIRLKLQKARRLLANTSLTVQEVAQQVGYDDRYYFSRLFRKLHGMPPMAYRRSQQTALNSAPRANGK